MEVGIRIGVSGDGATLARLLIAFNHEFETPAPDLPTLTRRFETLLVDSMVLTVLAETDEAVGFALVTLRPTPYHDGPLAQLDELYVVPDLRGGLIGTRILEQTIEVLTTRGVHEMHINVDEIDEEARRFYERHGFVNIEPGNDYRMLCYVKEF